MSNHEKLEIPADVKGRVGNGFVGLEIGWSKKHKNDGLARISIGQASATIALKDLLIFAFKHGSLEQKTDAIPVTQQLVKRYRKQHRVQVSKDIKAGETVVVNCEVFIPDILVEASTTARLSSEESEPIMKT